MLVKTWLPLVPFALLAPALSGACGGSTVSTSTCRQDTNVECGTGLAGYSCGGSDRPDLIADTTRVVAEPLCTTAKPVNGRSGYCCTSTETTCGYDVRVLCPTEGDFGFSCMGTNRPNSYDQNLICGQGIHEYGLISYCCGENTITDTLPDGGPIGCSRNTSVNCVAGASNAATLGFSCTTDNQLPTETDLGMNQSRSEVPLICALSSVDVVDKTLTDYCCYTPTAAPPSFTCLQDQLVGQIQNVPGCKAGVSYGFACIGTQDTPELDYPRMDCPNLPVLGTNQNGQSAYLYCCNYSIKP
jgi:hypothetical protein